MSIIKNTVSNSNYAITKFQSELKTFSRRCFSAASYVTVCIIPELPGEAKNMFQSKKSSLKVFSFLTVSLLETFKLISETIVLHVFNFYQQNLLQTSSPKIY